MSNEDIIKSFSAIESMLEQAQAHALGKDWYDRLQPIKEKAASARLNLVKKLDTKGTFLEELKLIQEKNDENPTVVAELEILLSGALNSARLGDFSYTHVFPKMWLQTEGYNLATQVLRLAIKKGVNVSDEPKTSGRFPLYALIKL